MSKSIKFRNEIYLDASGVRYKRKLLSNELDNIYNQLAVKVKAYKQTWGKSLTFPIYSPQQALILINNAVLIILWKAGGTTTGGYNFKEIFNPAKLVYTITTGENQVTISYANDISIAVFCF